MIKKQYSLSEIVEYFNNNKPKDSTESLDEFYEYLLTASSILTLVFASNPVTAITAFCATAGMSSIKISRLIKWLPDKFKFGKRDREAHALERHELSGIVNFLLLNLAVRQSFEDHIAPMLRSALPILQWSDEEKAQFEKVTKDADECQQTSNIHTQARAKKDEIEHYTIEIIRPLFLMLENKQRDVKKSKKGIAAIDLTKVKQKYTEAAFYNYNAYMINLSAEFPEFALWVDVSLKQKILKELRQSAGTLKENGRSLETAFIAATEKIIRKIEDVYDQSFSNTAGFPTFLKSYEDLFKQQEAHITQLQGVKSRENIIAHQNQIKAELNKPLVENDDIPGIIYPLVKDIYIAQSFEAFFYCKKVHGRGFLTPEFWGHHSKRGENIANELLLMLANPNFCNKPIVLLGNPGAGKSMLSKMFAGQLAETNDFIPFLIKLRNVATGTTNISEHIAKGLSKSIENLNDINWLEWAKEYRERTPVIILDGFDELMRFSQSELNNYLNAIKEFQEASIAHNVCCRVILTSRIAVMQDVNIPEGTPIIKLNGFDAARKALWIELWNKHQKKSGYQFVLPDEDNIQQLAEEPLLLFMLGVYDFESSELQNMVQTRDFSQSKLYDSLLKSFAIRQLEKNEKYNNSNLDQKKIELETFRLRLGMIALLMFLNDSTHKDTHNLKSELDAFELDNSAIQKDSILGGFFFIHENKSVTEAEIEQFNYEFLHKTFGEFLAADFMLRVAAKQYDIRSREKLAKPPAFRFCFGYNWLHKHNNILFFLMEHSPAVIPYPGEIAADIIERIIKTDLMNLFNQGFQNFTVNEYIIIKPREVIEHLAIYSQNLVFLWSAICGDRKKFSFDINDINDHVETEVSETVKYQAQDRDENNKNKILWKRLCHLWTLAGNKYATAKLIDWLAIDEKPNEYLLNKVRAEVAHNFGDAAKIACNDFERLLAMFDLDNPPSLKPNELLAYIKRTIAVKPELRALAIDALLYRLKLPRHFDSESIRWLNGTDLSIPQSTELVKIVFEAKQHVPVFEKYDIMRSQNGRHNFKLILREILSDMERELPEFKNREFLQIINDLLSSEAREKLFHYENDPDTLLNYVRILKKMDVFWITESRVLRGLFEDLVHFSRRGFREFVGHGNHIQTHLKVMVEIGSFYALKGHRHLKFYDEVMHDFFNEFNEHVRSSSLLTLEYLKAFTAFMDGRSARSSMPLKRIVDLLQRLVRDPDFLFQNDISVVVELFLQIDRLSGANRLKLRYDESLLEELVYRLISEIDRRSVREYWNFSDIIELLRLIRKQLPGFYISYTERFDYATHSLYDDLRSIGREEPNYWLHLVGLAVSIQSFFEDNSGPMKYFIRQLTENVMGDLGYISHEAPHIATNFLVSLLNMPQGLDFDENPALYHLISEVSKFRISRTVKNRIGLLLLSKNVPIELAAPFLENSQKLLSFYKSSPNIASELVDLINEIA